MKNLIKKKKTKKKKKNKILKQIVHLKRNKVF